MAQYSPKDDKGGKMLRKVCAVLAIALLLVGCSQESQTAAAWLEAIGTTGTVFVALVLALFQDKIRAWRMHPELKAEINLDSPDCRRTQIYEPLAGHVNVTGASDSYWPKVALGAPSTFSADELCAEDIGRELPSPLGGRDRSSRNVGDAYYLRLRIWNKGNEKEESVEVFAARLLKKQLDGTFKSVDSFLPMNLLWSHYRGIWMPYIAPGTYKHCDLAHIIRPESRKDVSPSEDHTWSGVDKDKTILSFDTAVQSRAKAHLVPPGVYRLTIIVSSAHTSPVETELEITLTGEWHDDEKTMFEKGIDARCRYKGRQRGKISL